MAGVPSKKKLGPLRSEDSTTPFITTQSCVAVVTAPEWNVQKALVGPLPSCNEGDNIKIDYQITLDRIQSLPNLCWIASYTLHNPTTNDLIVYVKVEIQQSGVQGIVGKTICGPFTIPHGPLPPDCGFGTLSGNCCGCTNLSIPCDENTEFTLCFSLLDVNQQSYRQDCPVCCSPPVECPAAPCYCLYDNVTVSGLNPGSVTVTKVEGATTSFSDSLTGQTPTFPINVCDSDFADSSQTITLTIENDYTVLPGGCPYSFNNIASIALSSPEGICSSPPTNCQIVSQSCIGENVPTISCQVTNICSPFICACKGSTVTPVCSSLSCSQQIAAFNALFPSAVQYQLNTQFGPAPQIPPPPAEGISSYVDISITSAGPLQNTTGYNGWCFDLRDIIYAGPSYSGVAISLADPGAGMAIEDYFNSGQCQNNGFDNINTSYLIGILQIFNNAFSYQNGTLGASWQDIQVSIWTLLFGNPTDLPSGIVDGSDNVNLPYDLTNVETIIADALIAQALYDSNGNNVCAALSSNNGVGGVIIISTQPCVQIMAIQLPMCAVLPPAQISYRASFQGDTNCQICITFSVANTNSSMSGFNYTILQSLDTACQNFTAITTPQAFDPSSPVTVCASAPQLPVSDTATCLQVSVTFTYDNELTTVVSDPCPIPPPSINPSGGLCLQDCVTFSCPSGCQACLNGALATIALSPSAAQCSGGQYAQILQDLFNALFPVQTTTLQNFNAKCSSSGGGPLVALSIEDVEALIACGLDYTLTFAPSAQTYCCGISLNVTNTLHLLIGTDQNCQIIAGVKTSKQKAVAGDVVVFPSCD